MYHQFAFGLPAPSGVPSYVDHDCPLRGVLRGQWIVLRGAEQ